jgi:hypothetical protein
MSGAVKIVIELKQQHLVVVFMRNHVRRKVENPVILKRRLVRKRELVIGVVAQVTILLIVTQEHIIMVIH